MILGRLKAYLFSRRAAAIRRGSSSNLQFMVYAPSHTHEHVHTYNHRVILANRWMTPGVVSYWCQTAPVPSVLIKTPLKNTVLMTRDQPVVE